MEVALMNFIWRKDCARTILFHLSCFLLQLKVWMWC